MAFSLRLQNLFPFVHNVHLPGGTDDLNCIITCLHVITGCCSFVLVADPMIITPPTQPPNLAWEKKGSRSIMPARVIEFNRQLMEGACCVIVAGDGRRRKGTGAKERDREKNRFRILCAIQQCPLCSVWGGDLTSACSTSPSSWWSVCRTRPAGIRDCCRQRSYRGAAGLGAYRRHM